MTLSEFFGLLRRHIIFVIVLPVILAVLTAGVCVFLPNEYTASTTMYVLTKTSANQVDPQNSTTGYSNLSAGQMLANDVITIAKSDRVATDVAVRMGMKSLSRYKTNVQGSDTSRIITLSVTGPDRHQAAAIANAYMRETASTAAKVMGVPAVNVVDKATVPASPSGPNRKLYVAAAFLVGLLAAACIVIIAERMNTKVRNDDEAQQITGLPVIAHFPQVRS
jgi:capsular polysaccharide biosynthesis protein